MKRLVSLMTTVGISMVAAAGTAPPQTPPGPGRDWTQEEWNNAPSMPNGGGIQFGGSTRGPRSMPDIRQRMQDTQRRMQQMQAQAEADREANMRQTLDVNEAQWARLKPRLDRIERLKAEVNGSMNSGGSFNAGPGFVGGATSGGGWGGGSSGFSSMSLSGPGGTRTQTWSSTSPNGANVPTKTGSLCQELSNLLQTPNVPAGQVSQKIADLRRAREQAQRDLARERKELRSLLNFRQEAALIALAYLD